MNKKLKMDFTPDNNYGSEYVLMPWDDKTVIMRSENGKSTQAYTRWELIQKQLSGSEINNVQNFIDVIKSYNVVFNRNGDQIKPNWSCPVLCQYFSQLSDLDRKNFFEKNGILSYIRNLALQLRELVPKLKLLKTGFKSSVKLHQLQIASILSNAFFCTFPKGEADCPSINFNTLYEGSSSTVLKYYVEKIKCLMHYFKRIHQKRKLCEINSPINHVACAMCNLFSCTLEPSGNLTFQRLIIPDHKFPRWDKVTTSLCSLKVDDQEKIEDQVGYLQMDFANKYVGGGVLGRGCVQEEIRFLICPELIAARLFTECLADNESLFVIGAERYCDYKGYSNTFEFTGDHKDSTPFDENEHRKTYLIVLDALHFHRSSDQYRESKILRELKKAYVGFKTDEEFKSLPLATGNWGCGAFGGDPQLKAILQIMASSQVHRNVLYLTFGNSVFKNQIEEFYSSLKNNNVTVGMLYRIIRLYNRERKKNQTVFEFVLASVSNREERKSISKYLPSTSKKSLSAFETDFGVLAEVNNKKQSKEEKTIDDDFPDLNIDFRRLDSEVEKHNEGSSKQVQKNSQEIPSTNSSILDVMWYENELNSSSKKVPEKQTNDSNSHLECKNSPSLFSEEEMEVSILNSSSSEHKNLFSGSTNSFVNSESENHRESKIFDTKKKFVQPKITNCFFKT